MKWKHKIYYIPIEWIVNHVNLKLITRNYNYFQQPQPQGPHNTWYPGLVSNCGILRAAIISNHGLLSTLVRLFSNRVESSMCTIERWRSHNNVNNRQNRYFRFCDVKYFWDCTCTVAYRPSQCNVNVIFTTSTWCQR